MTVGTEWLPTGLVGVVSLGGTAALMPCARGLATRFGIVDTPAPGKMHGRATPYLGGVAIAIVVLTQYLLLPGAKWQTHVPLLCALMLTITGLVDDMRTVSPANRLAVEVCAATLVCIAGVRLEIIGGSADTIFTIAWVVLLTNSFNLLDNLDGCAGLLGLITALALAVAAGLTDQHLLAGLAAAVGGACGGFLISNWHPARIFMGDAGALFLGFLLAVIALEIRFTSPQGSTLAPVLMAGVLLFDTTLVVLSRLQARVPIFTRGTDHTSHRLVRIGVPVALVPVVLGVVAAGLCAMAVSIGQGVLPPTTALVPLLLPALLLPALLRLGAYEPVQGTLNSSVRTSGRVPLGRST